MNHPSDHVLVEVEVRDLGSIGHGLFLTQDVRDGDVIAVFGGHAVPTDVFRQLPSWRQQRAIQVHDDVYMVSDVNPTLADYINHSCEPTGLLVGQVLLIAARDLVAGEQITYDYATSDSTPYDEFECECGAPTCRIKVTAEDWLDPALQARYAGHFSPYLAMKIRQLRRDD